MVLIVYYFFQIIVKRYSSVLKRDLKIFKTTCEQKIIHKKKNKKEVQKDTNKKNINMVVKTLFQG